jgi:hypothetical protein
VLAFFLLALLLLSGCREQASFSKPGPLFLPAKKGSSPAKAVVHVYWLREAQTRRKRLWVGPCDGSPEAIEPDHYITLVVEPGPACFSAEVLWNLAPISGLAIQEMAKVEFSVERGHTSFLRLEQVPTLLSSKFALQRIEAPQADPEIRRCRRLIPLTPDELLREYSPKGSAGKAPNVGLAAIGFAVAEAHLR